MLNEAEEGLGEKLVEAITVGLAVTIGLNRGTFYYE
jgi:hypothetical protein